jgi:nucleotide-binding universal stress UspA family protein
MKVFLVPVSNRPESKVALQVAASLAQRIEANISGCHLRPHRNKDSDYKSIGLPLFGSANRKWLDALDAKSTKSAARESAKIFAAVVEDAGFNVVSKPRLGASSCATWREYVGSPDRLMGILGPVADLCVVSRPSAKGHVGRMFMLAALLHSGRPVLVLPPKQAKTPGRRVAIAWNQSAEVSRVVSACMPILQTAEQVTIITCGPESRPGPKASQLKIYLRNWGINAKTVVSRGHNEQAELMAAYDDSKSDLLLMGAYSRSRLREIVFGGMTEHMLVNARIPVIMQHT